MFVLIVQSCEQAGKQTTKTQEIKISQLILSRQEDPGDDDDDDRQTIKGKKITGNNFYD